MNLKIRGARSEDLVIQHFQEKGFIFVVNNLSTYHAEVDLLFLSTEGELVLVEVKTVINDDLHFRPIVGLDQCRRLKKVFESLLAHSKRPVRLHLAAVNQFDQVTIFDDFLGDQV